MAKRSSLYVPPQEAEVRIRDIFESCRETPGVPFEEKGFMQFLMRSQEKPLSVTWGGSRRKARFMEMVESSFLICFPEAAHTRNWSYPDFCKWVSDRSGKDDPNRTLAKKYRRSAGGCAYFAAIPFLVFAAVAVVKWMTGGGSVPIAGWLLLGLPLLIAIRFEWKGIAHLKRIRDARSGSGQFALGKGR